MTLAVPFRLAAASDAAEREEWQSNLEKNVLPRFRLAEAVRFVDSATMCLLANGLTAGVVVHIGFDDLVVVPVIGGRTRRHAVQKRPTVGGHALSKYFAVMLQQTCRPQPPPP